MKPRTQQEIFRVVSQLVYWGLLGLGCWALIASKTIGPTTQIDKSVSCFIEERLNGWIIILDLGLQLVIAGLAAFFLSSYVDFVREEISRSFYALGAFTGCAILVLHAYNAQYMPATTRSLLADVLTALLLAAVPLVLGYGLFLRANHNAAASPTNNSGH